MEDIFLKEFLNNRSLIYTEEKRMPQNQFTTIVKKIRKLDTSISPQNSSRNAKAISSDIDRAINLNKEYQKRFNREILHEYKKLNTTFSQPSDPKFSIPSSFSINRSMDFERSFPLPSIKEKPDLNKTWKKYPKKRSRSLMKKPLRLKFIQNFIEKCDSLNSDIQNSKGATEKLKLTRKNMTDFLLDSEKYEKNLEDQKYNRSIKSYLKNSPEAYADTSSVIKKNQKFHRLSRIQLLSSIDSMLSRL